MPLVTHVLSKMKLSETAVADREDQFQAGVFGLMRAVQMYRPGKGTKFSTYAAIRIRGAILDGLRDYDRLSRSHRKDVRHGRAHEPNVRSIQTDKDPDGRTGPQSRDLQLQGPDSHNPATTTEREDTRIAMLQATRTILTPLEWCCIRARLRGSKPSKECKVSPTHAHHTERAAIAKLRRHFARHEHPVFNRRNP